VSYGPSAPEVEEAAAPLLRPPLLWHLSAPRAGLQFFALTIDTVYARPCTGCGHTLDDHGRPYGPAASFRREQCLACPCAGYRRPARELVAA
jgi:hypothetical protein